MKKFFKVVMIMLAVAIAAPAVSAQTYGLTEKEIKANKKEAEKQAKKAAKQLNKEKWIYSGANTLENELTNYLLNTTFSNGKREEMIENIPQAPSIRRGESEARSAAENDFVREIQIAIKGEIAELAGNASGDYVDTQVDKWSKRVAQELNGDIKRHFYIYKQNPDKTFQVRVYFSRPNVAGNSAFTNSLKNNQQFIEDIKNSMD
ncbi:MAG: hypothetical protein NC328_04630 [Muribaculum sp.]|nr:hypothetical protein [Muribaculum sp.]